MCRYCLFNTHIYFQHRLQHDKCHCVQSTLENVFTCPENNDILLKRLGRKKCDIFPQCQKEPLVYHCVRFEGELVEVCAPRCLIAGTCRYCVQ